MALIHFQPLDPLNLEDWLQWKHRFEKFCVTSKLLDAAKQINTLLYAIGEETEMVLASTNITEEE